MRYPISPYIYPLRDYRVPHSLMPYQATVRFGHGLSLTTFELQCAQRARGAELASLAFHCALAALAAEKAV